MSKPPYEILEHTADIGLKIYGRTLPELFVHSALGLVALAIEAPNAAPGIAQDATSGERVPLSAHGNDLEDLLVNWLSEVLYYMDAEGWLFYDFRILRCEDTNIEGEGWGHRSPIAGRSRAVAVKAVTYHQISVRETAEGWEAVVYFDI